MAPKPAVPHSLRLFSVVFLFLNVLVAERQPYVWVDEVYFCEPAMNWISGQGFISRAWENSPETEIFAASSPLYTVLMAGWLSVFGQSLHAVRSLNFVLTALAIYLVCAGAWRLEWIRSPKRLLWLAVLIACGYACALSYRGARPEPLGMLFLGVIVHSLSWPSRSARLFLIGALALLTPFLGPAVPIALCVASGVAFFTSERQFRTEAVLATVSAFLGAFFMRVLYERLGLWDGFIRMVESQGSSSLLQRVIDRLTTNPLETHNNNLPKDFSVFPVVLGLFLCLIVQVRRKEFRIHSALAFAVVLLITLPPALYLLGKFPTYYGWILFIPLALALYVTWDRDSNPRWLNASIIFSALVSCLVGLPFQMAVAAYDWADRDPQKMEAVLKPIIRPDDVTFCAWPFYYVARANSSKVYLQNHLHQMNRAQLDSVTLLILSRYGSYGPTRGDILQAFGPAFTQLPAQLPVTRRGWVGNNWEYGYLSLPNYEFDVFWRTSSGE